MSYPRITLKPGKEQSLRRRHPWVFSGAVQSTEGLLQNGDIVDVHSHQGNWLGMGHWAEGSISVRIFCFEQGMTVEEVWKNKLHNAFNLRSALGLTHNADTNMYRLVNAEGDGLPGLIIDVYNQTAVIQAHSAGMNKAAAHFARLLSELYGNKLKAVYEKSGEKQRKHSGEVQTDRYLWGAKEDTTAREHGNSFHVDWEAGQKTGFFIDQRENRLLLSKYARDKKVLNAFCYSGAFSVYALKAGASLVHSLDSSQRALELTEQNLQLNDLSAEMHECIKADAVEYLSHLPADYDIVVLDPPAFAKHLSARHKAVQGYKRINLAALKQMKSGSLLFTFSCSQAVSRELFNHTIISAAIEAGRSVRVLHQLHQPPDHPVSIYHPEGEYLKGLVLAID